MVLDPFLTVPDSLNMWILSLLCQGSFVPNFVVIRDIHFIIVFLLNDIIDILLHLSNRLREGIKMCLEGQHSV